MAFSILHELCLTNCWSQKKKEMHKVACLDNFLVHYRDRTSCKVQLWHCTKNHQGWLWGLKFGLETRLHFCSKDSYPPSTAWSPMRNRMVSFWKKRVRRCSFSNVCVYNLVSPDLSKVVGDEPQDDHFRDIGRWVHWSLVSACNGVWQEESW